MAAEWIWGDGVPSDNPKGKIGISVTLANSSSGTSTSVTIDVYFWSKYSAIDSSNTYYFNNKATNATTSRGSVSINHTVSSGGGWSTSNRTKLGTYTYNYSRGTSAQTFNCAAKLTGIDYVGGTMTVSASYTIPALKSYTVSYSANGGIDEPSSQTKYHGKNLTLRSTKPTRTGYTFKNWLSSAQSKNYDPGDLYGYNAATTMTAQWTAITYTVKYNANGGSGAPSNQTKTYGQSLKLSSAKPTRAGYNFKGWGTTASATTVAYAAGANYTTDAAVTLYAVWELAYQPPTATISYLKRASNSGGQNDLGTYIAASFGGKCDTADSSNHIDYVKYGYKKTSDSDYTYVTVVTSGSTTNTNGTYSTVFGNGGISVDSSYDVILTVADTKGGLSSTTGTVPSAKFVIDFLSGGKGVAMGKAAEKQDAFECAFDIYANSIIFDRFGKKVTNGFAEYSSDSAIDPNETTEHLILTDHTNAPMGSGTFYYILTVFAAGKSTTSYRAQIAIPYNSLGSMYHRYYNGSWSDWRRHRNATNDCLTSLWSGSWKTGTISVPNTAKYTMFAVKNKAMAVYVPCFKYSDNIRGGTFFTNASGGTQYMSDFTATISGETWTYVQCCNRQNTAKWQNSQTKAVEVTNIYGVM